MTKRNATTEAAIQDAVRLALGRESDLLLLRNNCGVAEQFGRVIRFGVGNPGGADLIGIFRSRFVALEIKAEHGEQNEDQKRFEQLVKRFGGEYAVVRNVDEARAWLDGLRRKYT